ncbi:SigE family RNA polymerase sigma factor [Cryptosporangium sp. NPDC051539]|uniref:SigE family RNA polymerase sigma factor n=1 Tax=Cryptosporangium sp. NPDC051539 TaxID=3363962 RepID=UPI00378DA022
MARDAEYVAFVEANWERYLRLARLLSGDRHRGEELLQDCLVRLYVRWAGAAVKGDPHPYLRRILVNANISWWRGRRREYLVETPPDQTQPETTGDEYREDLRRALLQLPARQRAVVVLRYYEDLTERETAAAMGCTVGTVKSQNARALRRLRELLDAHEPPRKVFLR